MSNRDGDGTVKTGYVCGGAFNYHIPGSKVPIFADVASLKKVQSCWPECGIYRIEVRVVEEVVPGSDEHMKVDAAQE